MFVTPAFAQAAGGAGAFASFSPQIPGAEDMRGLSTRLKRLEGAQTSDERFAWVQSPEHLSDAEVRARVNPLIAEKWPDLDYRLEVSHLPNDGKLSLVGAWTGAEFSALLDDIAKGGVRNFFVKD